MTLLTPAPPMLDAATRVSMTEGVSHVMTPAPNVLAFSCVGTVDTKFADTLIHQLDGMVRVHGRVYIFADTTQVIDYEPAFREEMTRWFKRRRKELVGVHVLVKSPLVKMGVAMINLLINNLITAHTDPKTYELALSTAAARR